MLRCTYIMVLVLAAGVLVVGCGPVVRTEEAGQVGQPVVMPSAVVVKLAGGYNFTEGPTADRAGNVFFSDIPNSRIHKWSVDNEVSVHKIKTGGANGLYFDKRGNLLACAGVNRMLVMYPTVGSTQVLADAYNGKKLNSPNDLWIDPKGGIYFTDPRYGSRSDMEQVGEHVYYLGPGRKRLIRVIDDMVRPNGVVGTTDGKKLYVADHGGKKTYSYRIKSDGTLTGKKLFCQAGSDGMTIDNEGNVYLTTNGVEVYNSRGQLIEKIEVPERPANVCFGGKDRDTLFITARTSLYSIKMRTNGNN